MRERLAVGVLMGGALGGIARRAMSRLSNDRGSLRSQEAEYAAAGHRVLILGSGFGGLETALALDQRLLPDTDASVLAVDRNTSVLFTPLLWMVADGRVSPTNVVVPIRAFQRGRRFHVLHGEVEHIDLDRREVSAWGEIRPYDTLVLALGSVTSIPDLPGLREHPRVFRAPADAVELRNHLITALEAAHRTDDPAERRACLTFVVGGGGDTGIELAATIHDYLHEGLLAEYPWLTHEPIRIVVVGRADQLVPVSDQGTSAAVRRALEPSGIEVKTGVSIQPATDDAVVTSEGEIPSRTLFWAAGISPPEIVRDLPVEHAKNGALIVDDHLRAPGRPEVYVVGDSAWAFDAETQQPMPPTAQAAQHEGRYVADAIARGLAGKEEPSFRFSLRRHLALLDHRSGVARVGAVTITVLSAWLLWHGYYLYRIPAWGSRLHLLADWLLAALTGRQTAHLRLGGGRSG